MSDDPLDGGKRLLRLRGFLRESLSFIGRYEIIREIGRGGMAVVYEGREPETGRPVAVKVFKGGTLDQARREALAAARLQYPGIVAVHEITPDYVVMPFVDGPTLAEKMPSESVAGRLRILDAVMRAVEHAHARGVAHQDIKPSNILIESDGHVLLTDFGLAKIVGDGGAGNEGAGTPHCMAPEQIDAGPAGFAADVWALGVLLHEMVTGHRPFDADDPGQIAALIRTRDPAPVSGPIGDVIRKALKKDPSRRYATVGAFREDLAAALARSPAAAQVPRRRLMLFVGVAVAAVTALAAAVAGILRRGVGPDTAPDPLSVRERLKPLDRQISAHSRVLERSPDSVADLVGRGRALTVRAYEKRERGENPVTDFAAAERDLDRAIALDPGNTRAYFERGYARSGLAYYKLKYGLDPLADCDAAERDFDRAIGHPEAREYRGNSRFHRGVWLGRQGRDGRPHLEAAERDLSPAETVNALMRRGRVRAHLGKRAEAEQDFAEAVKRAPEAYLAWSWRAMAELEAGSWEKAEAHATRAIALRPDYPDPREIRGHARFRRGDFSGAAADYEEALRLNPALEPSLRANLFEVQRRSAQGR